VKEELILQKYTRALFEVAEEHSALDKVSQGLKRMEASFREVPQLAELLVSPQVEWKSKTELAATLVQGLSPLIVNFVNLAMEKERQFILPKVAGEYQRLLDLKAKRKEAVVTTVIPLAESERKQLEDKLRSLFAEEFIFQNQIDPGIIGGIKVQMGFTVIDGTVKRKLEELTKALVS